MDTAHIDKQPATPSESRGSDVVAEALSYARKAEELRGTAIKQLLEQRERIEKDLKTLGYIATPSNGKNGTKPKEHGTKPESSIEHDPKRFKDLKLAEIGRVLLREHENLHGKDIERLAKAGGFRRGTNNFQNYLPVAFKRDGGFENIGGNTWKLKQTT